MVGSCQSCEAVNETEYQFGFGSTNQSERNQSVDLVITYSTDEPVPHPGNAKFDLESGYTISMHVKFDSACHDPAPDPATDLNWHLAGCSLLQYSLAEPGWHSFECGSRRFSGETWRADPDNSHQFASLHDLTGDASLRLSRDLNVCGAACRDAGFPIMEITPYVDNSESACKCFRVLTHAGQLQTYNCQFSCGDSTSSVGQELSCVANDLSTCPCGGYARSSWYATTDAFTLAVGVRNGKIYFGDNAQVHVDCSEGHPSNERACDVTGHIPLFTSGDYYNDGEFHHVVAEYSASDERMRLAVSKSDGSGYEIVERSVHIDGIASHVDFGGHREDRAGRWINDWAANPYPGNGWVEVDTGVWTMNAGGNGGFAGANMHSIRAYEGAHMEELLDETENPSPQPATSQDQCGCTLYNPPGAPPPPSDVFGFIGGVTLDENSAPPSGGDSGVDVGLDVYVG